MIKRIISQMQTHPAAATGIAILVGAVASMACTGGGVLKASEVHSYNIICPSTSWGDGHPTPAYSVLVRTDGPANVTGVDVVWKPDGGDAVSLVLQRCPSIGEGVEMYADPPVGER